MAKTGKGRKTGGRSSRGPREVKVKPIENRLPPAPELPPKPLSAVRGVATKNGRPKAAVLKTRSPLSVAFRHIRPTWRNYIEYVDLAARNGDEEMARFRDCYLTLRPQDQLHYWPEQLCELADVTPGALVGAVCRGIWESKAAESSMVSAMAHPEVLMATAKLAQQPLHSRDRELFFRLTGSLPDKKGASINIINNPTAQAGAVRLEGESTGRLKSMDEDVIDMTRQLDSPFDSPFRIKENVPPTRD